MARNSRPIFGHNNIFLGYSTPAYNVYGDLVQDISPELTKRILHDTNLFIPAEVEGWPYEPVRVRHPVCPTKFIIHHAKLMNLAYKVQLRETRRGILTEEHELSPDRVYLPFTWARYGMPVTPIMDGGVGENGLLRDEPVPREEPASKFRRQIWRKDLTREEKPDEEENETSDDDSEMIS
jgi:hypothetical protein